MTSYIIRRLLLIIPTVFLALSFLFFLFFALPGDPASLLAGGEDRVVDEGVVERINERYGLDDPLLVQFKDYWARTVTWDLGESFLDRQQRERHPGREVRQQPPPRHLGDHHRDHRRHLGRHPVGAPPLLVQRPPHHDPHRRGVGRSPCSCWASCSSGCSPSYPNKQGWPEWARLRTSGLGPDTWTFFFIPTGEQWRYLILPAVTLACVSTALAARMTRGSMLEVLRADYMRTAKAKGLKERSVVVKHGLRNAMLPVVTLIGLDFGTVIGAAILTETTFSWPGLGSEIANAVRSRDLPVLLGLSLAVVLAFAFINLIVDVSYGFFDPRIRLGKGDHS